MFERLIALMDFEEEESALIDGNQQNEPLISAMLDCSMNIWGGQPMNVKKMLVDTYGDKILIDICSPFQSGPLHSRRRQRAVRQAEAFYQTSSKIPQG